MSELEEGRRVGSYQLIQRIGQTGMSEVWRAQDRDGRVVALKTNSSQAGSDPQLRARFLREGGEHQLMKHPSIVPILDFFEQEGNFYLVMQYISGGSLEDRLEKLGWRALPIPDALKISKQILSALDYAHQKGVIHRDVKPSNILLDGDQAYLGDFGIALALGRPRLTTIEQVMGTRCYMSPEQIQTPLKITHLSDVYSFGCVLYEMLTGRQPYPQSDDSKEAQYTMLAKRVHEPPTSPRTYNAAIPARLERVVLTALSANPQDRFSGCGSFARALEGIETEKPGPVPPKPAPRPPTPVPPLPVVVTTPTKKVSVWGNVVAAVVTGLLWFPFISTDSEKPMIFVCAILTNIVLLRVLYKAWAALPANYARTTPGQAVGFMFVPFYNLYWIWNAYVGFAKDFNGYVKQVDPVTVPQPDGFYIAFCIFHFYLSVLVAYITPYMLILDFFILTPIMVGIMAGAINALSRVAEKLAAGRK
jgi:eukaryotic-like serine/threonine-protein kinase